MSDLVEAVREAIAAKVGEEQGEALLGGAQNFVDSMIRYRAALVEISQLSGSHFSKTIALGALAAPYGGTDKMVRTEFTEALVIEQRAR